jgi:predicted nucleotidyltransferase
VPDVEALASVPGPPLEFTFACQDVPEPVFLDVLECTTRALDRASLQWAYIGGIASAVHGRPRWTYDIDVFVQPQDAHPALRVLADAGFDTDEKDPHWLFKAMDRGVLVDIIFKATAGIYLDHEMIERTRRRHFRGVQVPVVAAEDLVVIKATAFAEHTPRHWWDVLGVLARADLDWNYLLRRARHSPGRVASVLLFARSVDIPVPRRVIDALLHSIDA